MGAILANKYSSLTQENQLFPISGIILWYADVALFCMLNLCYFTPQNKAMQTLKELVLIFSFFSAFFKLSCPQNVSCTAYTKLVRAELTPALGPFTWIFPQFLQFRLIDVCSNDLGSFFSKSLENTREAVYIYVFQIVPEIKSLFRCFSAWNRSQAKLKASDLSVFILGISGSCTRLCNFIRQI